MDRKQFLATLLVLPIGIFAVHCSSSSSGSGSGTPTASDPAAPPSQSGGMDIYTSSTNSAHSHTFSLDDTALSTPPAAGVSEDSSVVQAHSHLVTISMAQLQQVASGSSVQITSSNASGHTHVFTFVKIA
ncbi:MAG TPA: hypothetical protein VGL19_23050 [Polyangiaceae bacterium]|jgi:hypothetical protein